MKIIIATLLFIPAIAFASELSCGDVNEKRIIKGIEPTATILYEKLKNIDSGAWKNGFWVERFTYIGDVHTRNGKVYKIGFLTTEWGEACRATNRLFIFSSDNVCLGQYSGIMDPPVIISGSVLHFPFDAKYGNTLDLKDGPPARAWLEVKIRNGCQQKSSNARLDPTGNKAGLFLAMTINLPRNKRGIFSSCMIARAGYASRRRKVKVKMKIKIILPSLLFVLIYSFAFGSPTSLPNSEIKPDNAKPVLSVPDKGAKIIGNGHGLFLTAVVLKHIYFGQTALVR